MQCSACGHDSPESTRFCVKCGAALETAAPPPDPGAPPSPEPQPEPRPEPQPDSGASEASTPPATQKKKRGGCRTGCLWLLGILVLLTALALVVIFDVPSRLGLRTSDFEKTFPSGPLPDAGESVAEDFEAAGQSPDGLTVYVLPIRDTEQSLAYVILDQSKGYKSAEEGENPLKDAFVMAANSKAAQEAGVTYVAVEFREADGSTLMVMAAPVDAIKQLDAGTMSDEQFSDVVGAKGNLPRIIQLQMEEVQKWQQ